jgi:2-phosphoglycerate kinase
MATSLLATGVSTEEAYRLASVVQARLLDSGRSHVDADDLLRITTEALVDEPEGVEIAQRWEAWRRAKRSGHPAVIVLGGAPGVGKSTLATRLAVRLDITRVVTTDAIREVLRTVIPEVVLPELHQSTFEVTLDEPEPRVGIDAYAGFRRQCDAVTAATAAVADRLADEHRSMILEGVHLQPGAITAALAGHPADPIIVERLIVHRQADVHGEFLRRRAIDEPLRGGHRHLDSLRRIRAIQDHLERVADDNGVAIVDSGAAGDLTQDIVGEMVDRIAVGMRPA